MFSIINLHIWRITAITALMFSSPVFAQELKIGSVGNDATIIQNNQRFLAGSHQNTIVFRNGLIEKKSGTVEEFTLENGLVAMCSQARFIVEYMAEDYGAYLARVLDADFDDGDASSKIGVDLHDALSGLNPRLYEIDVVDVVDSICVQMYTYDFSRYRDGDEQKELLKKAIVLAISLNSEFIERGARGSQFGLQRRIHEHSAAWGVVKNIRDAADYIFADTSDEVLQDFFSFLRRVLSRGLGDVVSAKVWSIVATQGWPISEWKSNGDGSFLFLMEPVDPEQGHRKVLQHVPILVDDAVSASGKRDIGPNIPIGEYFMKYKNRSLHDADSFLCFLSPDEVYDIVKIGGRNIVFPRGLSSCIDHYTVSVEFRDGVLSIESGLDGE